jgi:hypothetical protein
MQLNATARRVRAAAVATTVVLALGALAAAEAGAHFSFGHYTYKERNSNGCRHHVDPINTVFYGSKAFARSTKSNIIHHMGWHDTSGSTQYFATHGVCYGMDFQRASGGGSDTRFHIRGKQGKDKDSKGRYETVGDAHHEDHVRDFGCGLIDGNHAVDSNGSNGSGFDQGRRQIARRFKKQGHPVKYKRWGNTEKFKQCDGDTASSNGLVAWILVNHFRH